MRRISVGEPCEEDMAKGWSGLSIPIWAYCWHGAAYQAPSLDRDRQEGPFSPCPRRRTIPWALTSITRRLACSIHRPSRSKASVRQEFLRSPNNGGDAFRAVYTVRPGDAIYVLHCIQKKSNRGIETPKREMDRNSLFPCQPPRGPPQSIQEKAYFCC
jgi:hypothetical protein